MHIQFQLVQQCIQISTRINILQCTYVHLRLFYIACNSTRVCWPKMQRVQQLKLCLGRVRYQEERRAVQVASHKTSVIDWKFGRQIEDKPQKFVWVMRLLEMHALDTKWLIAFIIKKTNTIGMAFEVLSEALLGIVWFWEIFWLRYWNSEIAFDIVILLCNFTISF